MKTLRQYLIVGLLFVCVIPGYACHCDPPIFDFYKNILRTDLICLAVCEGTGMDFQHNGLTAETAHFRVLDPMRLPLQQEGDTILVTGQDGLNCGESVTRFSAGDTIFLALGSGFYYEFERDTFYLEGACGTYYLKVENGKAEGLSISQVKEKIDYFKEDQGEYSYQMFHPHRALLLEGEEGQVRGLRIDSIWIEGDVHYFFNNNIRGGDYMGACATPYGPSWAGRKVIVRENGDHIFFNKQGDSIQIKNWAGPGESWRCYEGAEYLINARVESSDTMSFLGVSDSVKTISFQVYDPLLNEVDMELNHLSLMLSKQHGVISLLSFYLFPDMEEIGYDYREDKFASFDVVGMTSPAIGLQNFGWMEIFSFEIGDEFHIRDEYRRIDQIGPSTFRETNQLRQTILKVIGAEYSYEEFSYRIDRRESFGESIDAATPVYTYIHDTITRNYQPDARQGYIPDEAIIENDQAYSILMSNGPIPSKTIKGGGNIFRNTSDSCWSQVVWCGCFLDEVYYRGLGGPYGSCTGGLDSYVSISNDIIYYSKSWGTWGSPLTFTGEEPTETSARLRIYPNPARDHILISCDRFVSGIRIIDNTGRLILNEEGGNFKQPVSLNGIEAGMYLIGVQTGDKTQWERLIIY